MLWGKVIAQQMMSFTIVLNKLMLNREPFLQHYCEGVGHFTPLISIASLTRGGECNECL